MSTKIENRSLRNIMTRCMVTIPMSAAVVISSDGGAMGVTSGTDMIELPDKDNWKTWMRGL